MSEPTLKSLEHKLDALLDQFQRLEQENQLLKAERTAWHAERAKLIKQNELARDRVEAMIVRLRAMEQSE
ncbi:TIGR02449 family protein [Saccharospirillum impatiens]|uniref:TIGR02449 family protein n=1 Tax=Saccharospirillum impatiens TaxID=169438 RepID=UPI000423D171|nr:TIGR02449 family protein [Saccharospirillum impatiens]